MDLLIAIDQLDALVHGAPGIPLSRDVRLDRERLQAAIADLRRAIDAQFGLMTGGDPTATALKRPTQELEEVARSAAPVPLLGGVRIRRDRAYDLLDGLRGAVPATIVARHAPERSPEKDAQRAAIDALDDALLHAKDVPLTDQVRLDGNELAEQVAALRRAFATTSSPPASLGEIEAIVGRGRPVPLTPQVRVERPVLEDHLDALRRFLEER